jgi:membrane protease subunit HflC
VRDVVALERDVIMAEVRDNVRRRAEAFGVDIVDVRLKRIEFAPEIAESVYRRMESERLRVANELRSIGAAESEKIRASADREREQIVAQAYAKAQAVMGEGDAAAAALYGEAYSQDAEFFGFYKSLEAYRQAFGRTSDVLVVDPSSDFFRYMKSPSGRPAQ